MAEPEPTNEVAVPMANKAKRPKARLSGGTLLPLGLTSFRICTLTAARMTVWSRRVFMGPLCRLYLSGIHSKLGLNIQSFRKRSLVWWYSRAVLVKLRAKPLFDTLSPSTYSRIQLTVAFSSWVPNPLASEYTERGATI